MAEKDIWDKAGAIGVPIAVLVLTLWRNSDIKKQESGAVFAQRGLDILERRPNKNDPPGLREWAVKLVDRHSGIPMGPELSQDLINRSCLALVSVGLTASPGTVRTGESAHLAWSSTNADRVEITPSVGSVSSEGTATVSPTETTTYEIVGTNYCDGRAAATATVTVTGQQ